MSIQRRLTLGVLGSVFFLANPAFFTGCARNRMEFDQDDMVRELERISAAEWHVEGYLVRVDLHRPGAGLREDADGGCGDSRSFVTDADACATLTEMDIEGTLKMWPEDDTDSEPVVTVRGAGHYVVQGYHLNNGDIYLGADDQWSIGLGRDGAADFEVDELKLNGVGPSQVTVDYDYTDRLISIGGSGQQ